ncbi:expressed unknown protein [Seminavis robusta]|uniref:Uncharacterized protein n=1 Tax=Seminavis robusta TaxID=568900 RepID=A0A9N8DDV5_9STRA|nr:expressed unknown protein [Seminavis robusta]|eukprot:Sro48_g028210.1 n/a (206) ;mRNA; f:60813-61430
MTTEATAMDVDPPATTTTTASTGTVVAAAPTAAPTPADPESLNGCWILDKSKGEWSMRGYLETMNVNELAIKAHEKGEQEYDTFHTIQLTTDRIKITKRSRVNADLVVELRLGIEEKELLPPGDRLKASLAVSHNPRHLKIESSMHTVNGIAKVTDVKEMQPNDTGGGGVVLVQTLTVLNEQTGNSHTTTRYFIPYRGTPPHEVV